jgi:hypothetical protein
MLRILFQIFFKTLKYKLYMFKYKGLHVAWSTLVLGMYLYIKMRLDVYLDKAESLVFKHSLLEFFSKKQLGRSVHFFYKVVFIVVLAVVFCKLIL